MICRDEMITTVELSENKQRVKALYFSKHGYTIEGIIRWLIDREFEYVNFAETQDFYIFRQPGANTNYQSIYEILEGHGIGVELEAENEGREPGLNNPDEFSGLL